MYPTIPKDYTMPQMSQAGEFHHHHLTGIPIAHTTPAPLQIQSQQLNPWTSGLCDCQEDCFSCCVACICPCVVFGQIADIVDKGTTSCATSGALYALINCFLGFGCLYSFFYRSKIRAQHSLVERPCPDWAVHFFCETCALCQEYRELQNRGYDMSIGWQGNFEKRTLGATVPPGVAAGMRR